MSMLGELIADRIAADIKIAGDAEHGYTAAGALAALTVVQAWADANHQYGVAEALSDIEDIAAMVQVRVAPTSLLGRLAAQRLAKKQS